MYPFSQLSSSVRLRAFLIIASNCLGAFFSFCFGFSFLLTQRYSAILVVDFLTGILLILNTVFLYRTKNLRRAGLFTVALVGSFFFFLLLKSGTGGAGILWSYVFPIGAFFLLGLRNGLIVVCIYVFLCAAALLPPYFLNTLSPLYAWEFTARFFGSFTFMSFIAYIYEYARAGNQKNFLREIRERRRTERALIVEKEKAQHASRAKSRFVAVMSHELRTPLNGIIGMAGMLKETELKKKQSDYLDVIHACAQALLETINDTLEYSKIEAGRITLSLSAVDIRRFVDELIAMFKYQARGDKLTIFGVVDSDVPQGCMVDRGRLRQICINLLGNALKFTDKGYIKLVVSLSGDRICFQIRDTGPGIPSHTQQNLFQSFAQGEAGSTSHHKGSGLGLAISKELVNFMGGEIGVHSSEGQGATFRFTIPYLPVRDTGELKEAKEGGTFDSEKEVPPVKGTVLVAEDNEVNCLVIKRMLEKAGYHFSIVHDGRQALEAVRENGKFDLILMDIQMPEMMGYEASRKIRAFQEQHKIDCVPIIALTASALEGDRERCLEAGMNDYLSKPIRFEEFRDALRKWHHPCPTGS